MLLLSACGNQYESDGFSFTLKKVDGVKKAFITSCDAEVVKAKVNVENKGTFYVAKIEGISGKEIDLSEISDDVEVVLPDGIILEDNGTSYAYNKEANVLFFADIDSTKVMTLPGSRFNITTALTDEHKTKMLTLQDTLEDVVDDYDNAIKSIDDELVFANALDDREYLDALQTSKVKIQTAKKELEDKIAKEIEAAKLAAEKAAEAKKQTTTSNKKTSVDESKTYPGHWLEVDISNQTAYLRDGDQRVQSFIVSTGKSNTPSDIGVFKVWAKRSIQDIKGVGYSYPGTKWLTYYNGGEAFHTAYWHENFGTPMSHGCVNMREAEAKIVYDWAKKGTIVVVHP